MREDMGFIVRPVVQVGQVPAPPRPGCPAPERLTTEAYRALRNAAPFCLSDLAAILSDRAPFELEPHDDPRQVQDWQQILERLEAAVARGELPPTPTLKEGLKWARSVGIPVANLKKLRVAASGQQCGSDFDPELQRLAEEAAGGLHKKLKGRPKKEQVAEEMRRLYGVTLSESSIARRIRHTW